MNPSFSIRFYHLQGDIQIMAVKERKRFIQICSYILLNLNDYLLVDFVSGFIFSWNTVMIIIEHHTSNLLNMVIYCLELHLLHIHSTLPMCQAHTCSVLRQHIQVSPLLEICFTSLHFNERPVFAPVFANRKKKSEANFHFYEKR